MRRGDSLGSSLPLKQGLFIAQGKQFALIQAVRSCTHKAVRSISHQLDTRHFLNTLTAGFHVLPACLAFLPCGHGQREAASRLLCKKSGFVQWVHSPRGWLWAQLRCELDLGEAGFRASEPSPLAKSEYRLSFALKLKRLPFIFAETIQGSAERSFNHSEMTGKISLEPKNRSVAKQGYQSRSHLSPAAASLSDIAAGTAKAPVGLRAHGPRDMMQPQSGLN
jgi:hypothetical protein